MCSGVNLPAKAIREQINSAIHVIVQATRLSDGSRKITSIQEITGMEGEIVTMQEIFRFRITGRGDHGEVLGQFGRPLGLELAARGGDRDRLERGGELVQRAARGGDLHAVGVVDRDLEPVVARVPEPDDVVAGDRHQRKADEADQEGRHGGDDRDGRSGLERVGLLSVDRFRQLYRNSLKHSPSYRSIHC